MLRLGIGAWYCDPAMWEAIGKNTEIRGWPEQKNMSLTLKQTNKKKRKKRRNKKLEVW
jgi:hypothetical protein